MRLLIVLILALLIACTPVVVEEERVPPTHEITEVDVVSSMMSGVVTSLDVGVKGVKLGDSKSFLLANMGPPDNFTRFEGEGMVIENYEYGTSLGLERTGLLFHLQNDVIHRITLRETFNGFLMGLTKIDKELSDIYFEVGIPDEKEVVWRYMVQHYNAQGLELITYLRNQIGLSLRTPRETDRNISTEVELDYIPYSSTIEFK